MRSMKSIILTIAGALSVAALVTVASFIPDAMLRYEQEPEDTWLLFLYLGLFLVMAVSFFGAAITSRKIGRAIPLIVAMCSGVLVLFGIFAVGTIMLLSRQDGGHSDSGGLVLGTLFAVAPLYPLYVASSVLRRKEQGHAPNN